jgi:hypothetical protein
VRLRRISVSFLCVAQLAIANCSGTEHLVSGRTPDRLLVYTSRELLPAVPGDSGQTLTDSVWLYNARITVIGRTRYRVWLETTRHFNPPLLIGTEQRSDRQLTELDCKRRAYRQGKGEGIVPDSSVPWQEPAPNAVMEIVVDSSCVLLRGAHGRG